MIMVRIEERHNNEWVPIAYVRVTHNDTLHFTSLPGQVTRFVFLPPDLDYGMEPLGRASGKYLKGSLG